MSQLPREGRAYQNAERIKRSDDERTKIARILRAHFHEAGITETELAHRLGVSLSTISKTLNAKLKPESKRQLKNWIKALKVKGEERKLLLAIYGGEGDELVTRDDIEAAGTDITMAIHKSFEAQIEAFEERLVGTLEPLISAAQNHAESFRTVGSSRQAPGEEARSLDPAEFTVALERFRARYDTERWEEAIEAGNLALDLAPHQDALGVLVAQAYEKAGKTAEAVERATALLRSDVLEPILANPAIRILLRNGKSDRARPALTRLLESKGLEPTTALLIADALIRKQSEAEAEPYVQLLLETPIPFLRAASHYLKAITLYRRGDLDGAKRDFQAAADTWEGLWEGLVVKGQIEQDAGGHSDSAHTWLELARRRPDTVVDGESIHAFIAGAYRASGDKEMALSELHEAIDVRPAKATFNRLMDLLFETKSYEEGIRVGEEARRRRLASGLTLGLLGIFYFASERHCLAADRLREFLTRESEPQFDWLTEIVDDLLPIAAAKCESESRL